MDLLSKKCVPCEGGVEPFTKEEAEKYLKEVPGWRLSDDSLKIEREFKFSAKGGSQPEADAPQEHASGGKDFKEAMSFVNKVADLAENEGHHPDIYIFYNRVRLELSTHAVSGLSENDFILAAKVNRLI